METRPFYILFYIPFYILFYVAEIRWQTWGCESLLTQIRQVLTQFRQLLTQFRQLLTQIRQIQWTKKIG